MADRYDAVLVGAGIMGATLAALLHELDPAMRLLMLERLDGLRWRAVRQPITPAPAMPPTAS